MRPAVTVPQAYCLLGHSFVPSAAKWLESGADDDDDDVSALEFGHFHSLACSNKSLWIFKTCFYVSQTLNCNRKTSFTDLCCGLKVVTTHNHNNLIEF